MADDTLVVWRDGAIHGRLTQRRGAMTFTYASPARPISVSLPVRARAYGDRQTRPWFRGLLPEGQIRAMIAYDLGIDGTDDFSMLRALGRDCAGALSVRPGDDEPNADTVGPALTDHEIGQLLRALPTSPMGVEQGFRLSLPGNQHKLLLARSDGRWHRPDGAPSTHILKPMIQSLDATTVGNEAYCQWLAASAGLPAAATSIGSFDGVEVLISERFDRTDERPPRRVHQEDGCQALGVDPEHKYQTHHGGPSLRTIAAALITNGGDPGDLLRVLTFSTAIGNADLHGKNVSFVFDDDDSVSLAPIYDAMCTRFYDTTRGGQRIERSLGMRIAGETQIDDVAAGHLVTEGRTWGLSTALARRTVHDTLEALRAALDRVEPIVDGLDRLVQARIDRLASAS